MSTACRRCVENHGNPLLPKRHTPESGTSERKPTLPKPHPEKDWCRNWRYVNSTCGLGWAYAPPTERQHDDGTRHRPAPESHPVARRPRHGSDEPTRPGPRGGHHPPPDHPLRERGRTSRDRPVGRPGPRLLRHRRGPARRRRAPSRPGGSAYRCGADDGGRGHRPGRAHRPQHGDRHQQGLAVRRGEGSAAAVLAAGLSRLPCARGDGRDLRGGHRCGALRLAGHVPRRPAPAPGAARGGRAGQE